MRLAVFVAVLGLSCGGGGALKRAGDECAASSECGAGLICDLNRTPHVCAGQGILDAFVEPDASHIDAAPIIDGPGPLPDAHVTPDGAVMVDAAVMIDAPVMVDAAVMIDAPVTPDAAVMVDAPTD